MNKLVKKYTMSFLVITLIMALGFTTNTVLAISNATGYKAPFAKGSTYTVSGTHDRVHGRHALDFATPLNTPVLAMKAGTIVFAGIDKTGGGNMVKINHGGGICSLYLHLNSFVKTSGSVKQGEIIAKSGNTTYQNGQLTHNASTHLHVSVYSCDNSRSELPIIFDEVGRELNWNDRLTSSNVIPTTTVSSVFVRGVSTLYQDQSWNRANLKICADNLPNRTVFVRFFRNGREWNYSQKATSTCVTFWNLDGSGPLNGRTTYYSQASLDKAPNPNWPIPCAGYSGGLGLCDSLRRP